MADDIVPKRRRGRGVNTPPEDEHESLLEQHLRRQLEIAEVRVAELLDEHDGDAFSALCDAVHQLVWAEYRARTIGVALPKMLEDSKALGRQLARRDRARLGAAGRHEKDQQLHAKVDEWFADHHKPEMTLAALAKACKDSGLFALADTTIDRYASQWKTAHPNRKFKT